MGGGRFQHDIGSTGAPYPTRAALDAIAFLPAIGDKAWYKDPASPIGRLQAVWGGTAWSGGYVPGGPSYAPGSPSSPFTSEAQRTAWATANLSTLRSGVSTVWGPGGEYVWKGPLATDWVLLGVETEYVDLAMYPLTMDGVTPNDESIQLAAGIARLQNRTLRLPPGEIAFTKAILCNKILGVRGKTTLIPVGDFEFSPYGQMVGNVNFTGDYNASADTVSYRNFGVEIVPTKNISSCVRIANVAGGEISGLHLTAKRNVDGNGKAFPVDSLIDLWGPTKRVKIHSNILRQETGAFGASRTSEGGGGCIWIRCFQGALTQVEVDKKATEKNVIEYNDLYHWTSDEAIALFGVRGVVRNNTVRKNQIYCPPSTGGVFPYRPTTVSCFPLNDGSPAGAFAAVYNNTIKENNIEDWSCFYNGLRIGNTPDANNPCHSNVSQGNTIAIGLSGDATNGQHAVWVSEGSIGTDPSTGMIACRCINGTQGVGYPGASSGNKSIDDTVASLEGTIFIGFSDWHSLVNASCRGSIYIGALSCRNVQGGDLQCGSVGLQNCSFAVGARIRCTISSQGTTIIKISTSSEGISKYSDLDISSSGVLLIADAVTVAGRIIDLRGIAGSLNATAAAIVNNGASRVAATDCTIVGVVGAVASGAGSASVVHSGNIWAGVTD